MVDSLRNYRYIVPDSLGDCYNAKIRGSNSLAKTNTFLISGSTHISE